MMRTSLTVGVWIVALSSLTMAGTIAAAFIFMATSLDPTEIITAGTEPWTDALRASLAFIGVVAVTVLSLALWHSVRFKIVGLVLTIAAAGYVAWTSAKVYADYF